MPPLPPPTPLSFEAENVILEACREAWIRTQNRISDAVYREPDRAFKEVRVRGKDRGSPLLLLVSGSWLGYNGGAMRPRNGSAVLERLLDPVSRSLNVEAARKLVRLRADPKSQARVDQLARKCNEGELTPAERAEYERYVTAGNLIAILQAKARLLLTRDS